MEGRPYSRIPTRNTNAQPQPVLIAPTQTPIPITGTITATNPSVGSVNATSPVSATLIGGTDSGGKLQASSILALTDAKALTVAIVDANGDQITSFGGGTQYTDAGTPPAHPIGNDLVFNNAGVWAQVTNTTGFPVAIIGTPSVNATLSTETTKIIGTVNIASGQAVGLSAGTQVIGHVIVDSGTITTVAAVTAITNALPAGTNILGKVSQDTSPWVIAGAVTEATLDAALIAQEATTLGIKGLTLFGAVTTGKPTYTTAKSDALSLDVNGLLRVSLADTPANTNKLLVTADAITFASPQHIIADSGTITTVSAVTAITNALPAGTNVIGHVIVDSGTITTVSAVTAITNALPAGSNVIGHVIVDSGTVTTVSTVTAVTNITNAVSVVGSATGSAVPAGAFYQGLNASTALPTAATAGNLTGGMSDKFGRQVVLPVTIRDLTGTQTTTLSNTTSETTIVTQAALVFNDLLLLVLSNTSATATRVDFRDSTGGSILFSLYAPAGDTRGFSLGGVAIPQTAVNTNWTAQCETGVTDLRIYAVFAKNR